MNDHISMETFLNWYKEDPNHKDVRGRLVNDFCAHITFLEAENKRLDKGWYEANQAGLIAATSLAAEKEKIDHLEKALQSRAETEKQLRDVLESVLSLIDSGWLIRDISHDHEEGWAIKQLGPVRDLGKARELIDNPQALEAKHE